MKRVTKRSTVSRMARFEKKKGRFRRFLDWFQSRLYHKLVFSHMLFLLLFLLIVGIIGHYAFRSFSRMMFREQFDRQATVLFSYLQEALKHNESTRKQRTPSSVHPGQKKKIASSKPTTRPLYKHTGAVLEQDHPKYSILRRHIRNSSRFLVTLVSVTRPDGRCVLEAYPPDLLNATVDGKRLKKRRWHKLLRSPYIVVRKGVGGTCDGVRRLVQGCQAYVHSIVKRTFRVRDKDVFSVQYYSLSLFHSGPRKGSFMGVLLFIFCLAMILVLPVNRSIARPLQHLTQVVHRIRSGELTIEVPVTGRDEVGQLASAVEDMRSALFIYQEQRRALLSDISHEIRTPLARVRVVAESVADGLMREEERLQQAMDGICRQVDDIDQLLGDLIDIARFELSSEHSLEYTSFSVHTFVEEMYRSLSSTAEAEQVRLIQGPQLSPDVSLWADRRRMKQVVYNLVHNAIRHSASPGRVQIDTAIEEWDCIETGERTSCLALYISDDGEGVPIADRERIFERFVRLDPSRTRETGGQGLGLAIAHQIVEAHEGMIGVDVSDWGGACFWIRLPLSISK